MGFSEFYEHLIEPRPVAMTPWSDRIGAREMPIWKFELAVDERGVVSAVGVGRKAAFGPGEIEGHDRQGH